VRGKDLDEVVEDAEALRVLAGLDVDEGANLGGGEGDVLVAHNNLELLPPHAVGLWPVVVVLLHNLGLLDDPPGLAEDGGGDEDLLADHGVVLVVGVVGVAELAVGAELELEELVPELPLVPHVVPQVELAAAGDVLAGGAARRHRSPLVLSRRRRRLVARFCSAASVRGWHVVASQRK
jgi:hypothetical protein